MTPPNEDKPSGYVMSDDERATIGRKLRDPSQVRGIPATMPPPLPNTAKKQGWVEALIGRVPLVWKALTLVAGILLAGAAGYAALVDYTKKYATKEELAKHLVQENALRAEVQALRESDATRAADIASIKTDTAAVREDIRTLLQFMLINPPARASSDKPRKP